jgi:hypothetical protein
MTYDLKNVFYLGNNHQYDGGAAASKEWIAPIDVSAYVDPISKGRARGQGLAVYKVHSSWQKDDGGPPLVGETGGFTMALSVKPFTTTGDELAGEILFGDMQASNDLVIFGQQWTGSTYGGALTGTPNAATPFVEPSEKVPYVVVRDTIFQIASTSFLTVADVQNSVRMECAMITLDTATLNQLLRTQTA